MEGEEEEDKEVNRRIERRRESVRCCGILLQRERERRRCLYLGERVRVRVMIGMEQGNLGR